MPHVSSSSSSSGSCIKFMHQVHQVHASCFKFVFMPQVQVMPSSFMPHVHVLALAHASCSCSCPNVHAIMVMCPYLSPSWTSSWTCSCPHAPMDTLVCILCVCSESMWSQDACLSRQLPQRHSTRVHCHTCIITVSSLACTLPSHV